MFLFNIVMLYHYTGTYNICSNWFLDIVISTCFNCIIMDCIYKGVCTRVGGSWRGGVVDGGGWVESRRWVIPFSRTVWSIYV